MLLVRDGQEDAIINGNRTGEESGGVSARDGDVPGITAQSRSGGLFAGARPITRLKRNPGRLRRAVRRPETGIADEHLAVAAIGAARGSLQRRGNLIRGMARCDGQKRDEASRRADGRQNAFRPDQCSVRIGGD